MAQTSLSNLGPVRLRPLNTVTIFEVVTPEGGQQDPAESVEAGSALALYQSIHWALGSEVPSEPLALARLIDDIARSVAAFGDPDYHLQPDEADHVIASLALCQRVLVGFLRIASKTNAELSERFRVGVVGGAR